MAALPRPRFNAAQFEEKAAMRRVFAWFVFAVLVSTVPGCEDPNPPGMPKEEPKGLSEEQINRMKGATSVPKSKPVAPKEAPAEKKP
jgi:hypothetical protein